MTKRETGKRRRPSPVGWPETLIALGWVAVWGLWPSEGRLQAWPRGLPAPQVTYTRYGAESHALYVQPDLIARASILGGALTDEESLPSTEPVSRQATPRYLERIPTHAGIAWEGNGYRHPLEGPYRLVARAEPVFGAPPDKDMHLAWEVSRALRDRAFRLPSLDAEAFVAAGRPWQVRVHVDVGADGVPEHVFLETPCEFASVNAEIVRRMYEARPGEKGSSFSGWVSVSYGPR